MAVQILVLTNDASGVQGIRDALEARRARVMVHALDESILVVAREARPAALLLDVSMGDDDALQIMRAVADDPTFEGTPIFGLFGSLQGATSYYEDLSQPTNAAAEILAIAELNAGFSESSSGGIFDGIDADVDIDAFIGPGAKSGLNAVTVNSNANTPPPRRPPPPPPRPGARTTVSSPAINVTQGGNEEDTLAAVPTLEVPRRPRTTTTSTLGGADSLALRDEINQKDREILELRSRILELERSLLDKDGSQLEVYRRVAESEGAIASLEEELDSLQAEIAKRDEAIAVLRAEAVASVEAAEAVQREFEERRQEFQELLDAREAELISEADQRIAALHDEYESLIAERVAEAVNNALAEAQARHAEELERVREEASKSSEVEEQLARVAAQRDEVLAISQDLENALAQSDQQVAALTERLRASEGLIAALRADLANYVEAAHSAATSQREALQSIASLADILAAARESVVNASQATAPELPETTWESAYVEWQRMNEVSAESDADEHDDTPAEDAEA